MPIPNFIEIYNNVITNQEANEIINLFEEGLALGYGVSRQEERESNAETKLFREDKAIYLPKSLPYATIGDVNLQFVVINGINKCVNNYANTYASLLQGDSIAAYNVKIQKTEPGQGYHVWQSEIECRSNAGRVLTWTLYLNDNFEAGETEFLYQQYRYKPKQGDVVIFPAGFTHTHRGNPPINGNKYIVTGWMEY